MVGEDFTILDQVPPVVPINVGGQVFVTSRDTLLRVRFPSSELSISRHALMCEAVHVPNMTQ